MPRHKPSSAHTGLGAILTAPCSTAITRHVLLIGTTGKGKTTISNMLQNNSSAVEACLGPGHVGHGAGAGTGKPRFAVMPERQMMICDTIGLGDPHMSNEENVKSLKTIFNSCRIGLSCVIVVSSMGRWSKEERKNIELLDTLFEDDWKKQSILVLTHYEDELEDKEEELDKWCRKDPQAKEMISKFAHINVTDNNVKGDYEEYTRPLRANCLKELSEQIATFDATITIKPVSFLDFIVKICDCIFRLFGEYMLLQKAYDRLTSLSRQGVIEDVMYSGTCPVCLGEINLADLAMTQCNHSFHRKCIDTYIKSHQQSGSQLPCPICRQHIRKVYLDSKP